MTTPTVCPDSSTCARLNRHACVPGCALNSGLCGACLPGFFGELGDGIGPCAQPTYGDGTSAEQAARDCVAIQDALSLSHCEKCPVGLCSRNQTGQCEPFTSGGESDGFHCRVGGLNVACPPGRDCWTWSDTQYYTLPVTSDCASANGVYFLRDRLTGTAYEAYCDMETVGGGWTLAAVISNTDGQDHFGQNSWFSITDCELQGLRAPTPVWTSGEPFGDTVLTPETTVNSKSAAYFSVAADSIMIREVQGSQRAMRAYSLDSSFGGGEMRTLESLFRSTPDHNEFTNRATCSELVGSSWQTSAFVQFEEIDFNYQLTDDGAVLTPGAAVEQASAGLACRVDGTCNFGYDGNVCQGGSERHYNQGAVDELHTVWLYVRPRSMHVFTQATVEGGPCPDGYVQVSDESVCSGAATVDLVSQGLARQWSSTGSWDDHVGGCFEGFGSVDGTPGNGNVHFSTRSVDYIGGNHGYRICEQVSSGSGGAARPCVSG
eukprot:SAG31_NODE_45_length_31062_cov_17.179957_2_plen_490_part_00